MERNVVGKYGGAIVSGVAVALLAQLFALMLGAPGEGWMDPFNFSLTLFIFYPVVFVRLKAGGGGEWIAIDLALLAAAVALDFLLARQAFGENEQDFLNAMADTYVTHAWIGLWLLWQALTIKLIIKGILPPRR